MRKSKEKLSKTIACFALAQILFLASADLRAEPSASEGICQTIQQKKAHDELSTHHAPSLLASLEYLIDPGSAIDVARVSEAMQLSNDAGDIRVDSPVPIIVFQPETASINSSLSEEQADLTDLKESINAFQEKYFTPLEQAQDYESCVALANSTGITNQLLSNISQTVNRYFSLQDKIINQQLPGEIKKTSDRYQFVKASTASRYQDILTAVSSEEYSTFDIVLILHGSEDGSLLDLSGQFIPPSFFEAIVTIASVRNIIIYACNSEKVAMFYSEPFLNLQNNSKSIFMGKNRGILSGYNVMVASLFHNFLEKYISIQDSPNEDDQSDNS